MLYANLLLINMKLCQSFNSQEKSELAQNRFIKVEQTQRNKWGGEQTESTSVQQL